MEVVNNPQTPAPQSDGGLGFLLGIIVIIAFVFALPYLGLPALRNANTTAVPQSQPAQQPSQTQDAPSIDIPDEVDINIDDKTDDN